MNKEEALKRIETVLEEPFAAHGFVYRRKGVFERIKPVLKSKQQYCIDLSKNKGYFHLHLKLVVENAGMMKDFDSLLKKARAKNVRQV